ncbi:MAG: DUF4124 domain-containing protein [Gammaproteobacteria bacterium]|nr:DUF4124 domain-containing protein [Gammaproteobacteria bacterium]
MYKWVDDKGEVHYGDRIPPEYSDRERKKINERGRTLKVYEAARTPEEIAEAKRLRAIKLEQEKLAAEEARKDHILMATYSSEDDMLKTRDGKLSSLEGLIQLTYRRNESMNRRIKQLTEDAADFERSGKMVPDILKRQIENIRTQTSENETFILVKKQEQDVLNRQFQKDIARFRELKEQKEMKAQKRR